jgi:hypothetical protein
MYHKEKREEQDSICLQLQQVSDSRKGCRNRSNKVIVMHITTPKEVRE